ncbi:DUF4935 domain-containing protein (plasmid) [Macrococcoides bohemicum]|uniref:PIN-like domain-containing protein n=1 Tax=Macrococcoides bohemicum TaxID=1903056 RepID=UPI001C5D8523|nr:PIN-like domain-containing protein [Macrococcus bohemicus]QYA46047.1 DUF4935 domain-containing protein [Macrococcus bohemicus]
MKGFEGFIQFTEQEKKKIWDEGIFVIDTNILIKIYKYKNKDNYKNLLQILNLIKSRNQLYIPHHVVVEYMYNKDQNKNINEIEYDKISKVGKEYINDLFVKLEKKINEKRILDIDILSPLKEDFNKRYDDFVKDLSSLKQNNEEILNMENEIENLLETVVGKPFDQETITDIQNEGEERYKKSIPPGYKDNTKDKSEYRTHGTYSYDKRFGDLIIWKDIIKYSQSMNKPIIFISDDLKSDWCSEIRGEKKGLRPDLKQEFYEKTKSHIISYNLLRFIELAILNFSKTSINQNEKDILIDETKSFSEITENKLNNFNDSFKLMKQITKEKLDQIHNKYNGPFQMKPEDRPKIFRSDNYRYTYNDETVLNYIIELLNLKYGDYVYINVNETEKSIEVSCIPLISYGVKEILNDLDTLSEIL